MKYGLIGKNVLYSLSGEIHKKCGLNYDILSVGKRKAKRLLKDNAYLGFNLTIPYKRTFIDCFDGLIGVAKELKVVNTVKKEDGKIIGYNTDYNGLIFAVNNADVTLRDKSVVILGTGASSLTAEKVAVDLGAKSVDFISRKGKINYKNYEKLSFAEVVINTTPVGTFPFEDKCLIDLSVFKNLYCVIDLVYNPINTELLLQAKQLNVKVVSGISMLCEQALLSQDIWLNKTHGKSDTLKLISEIKKENVNLILSGMAGVGKTTVGTALKERLNKDFFDADEEFFNAYKITPEKFIIKFGEKAFRKKESKIINALSKKRGVIIALGGGSVLDGKNVLRLKHSGIIFLLEREVSKLCDLNRPLSKEKGIEQLYKERYEIYRNTCDFTVNAEDTESALGEIVLYYENYCN